MRISDSTSSVLEPKGRVNPRGRYVSYVIARGVEMDSLSWRKVEKGEVLRISGEGYVSYVTARSVEIGSG